MKKYKPVTGSIVNDRRIIQDIATNIVLGKNVMIFSSDGSGVRSVNEFLSDDQLEDIEMLVAKYLADEIADIDDQIYMELFADKMNPPVEEEKS